MLMSIVSQQSWKKNRKKTLLSLIVASGRVDSKAPAARVTTRPGLPRIEKYPRKLELSSAKTRKVLDILGRAAHPLCGRKEIYILHWKYTHTHMHTHV